VNPNYSYAYYPWVFTHNTSRKAGLNISYKTGGWVLQTGIGYWKDGYTRSTQHLYIISLGNPGLPGPTEYRSITQTLNYLHTAISFSLGYQFPLAKKLSLTPFIGAIIANNAGMSVNVKEDSTGYTQLLSNSDFKKGYRSTSWWATTEVDINYMLAPRWKIIFGPRWAYMFTSMVKNEYWTYEQSSFKLYNITFNAGIAWALSK
jgi:hypothetical protein